MKAALGKCMFAIIGTDTRASFFKEHTGLFILVQGNVQMQVLMATHDKSTFPALTYKGEILLIAMGYHHLLS